MKIRTDGHLETFLYCAMCVLSLGMVFLARIVITTAIKMALKDSD